MAAGEARRRVLKVAPVIVAAALAAFAAGPDAASLAKVGSAVRVPPEKRTGLRPGLQLAAMRTGVFRDQDSGCYVWLNLAQAPLLDAQEICKLALHGAGHLGGLQHTTDPGDVMYSPFESQPTPAPCSSPLATAARSVN